MSSVGLMACSCSLGTSYQQASANSQHRSTSRSRRSVPSGAAAISLTSCMLLSCLSKTSWWRGVGCFLSQKDGRVSLGWEVMLHCMANEDICVVNMPASSSALGHASSLSASGSLFSALRNTRPSMRQKDAATCAKTGRRQKVRGMRGSGLKKLVRLDRTTSKSLHRILWDTCMCLVFCSHSASKRLNCCCSAFLASRDRSEL
mmetsp:Transcript_21199/g.55259  ORF Transcript_21199/g.55259 Transcript_21199/m.55259 type:complete len:203 (-) Transcript_21199:961-1569(-)